MIPKYISIIIWEDASFTNNTDELDEMRCNPMILVTAGLLVSENDKVVNLALQSSEYDDYRHTMTILKNNIVFRKDIRLRNIPSWKELKDDQNKSPV